MDKLAVKAWLALLGMAIVMGCLLFLPAGTLHYWQGWVFLWIYLGGSSVSVVYMRKKSPTLLSLRLKAGPMAERRWQQRVIMSVVSLDFVALLVVSALDHRYGWSKVPLWVELAGCVLIVVGLAMIFLVCRENPFAWATIEVRENQMLISTGPYALVRHPLYAASFVYLFGMPLALGSWYGFVPMALMLPFLLWRLVDEERMLAQELPGYEEYQIKVRWRLIPRVF